MVGLGGWRMVRLALAIAGCVGVAAMLPALAGADLVGPPLADPHIGVPLGGPTPPLVDGVPPDFVSYRWERCHRYAVLVDVDRPSAIRHLDFDVADGAIDGTVDYATRFDGVKVSVDAGTEPDISGTKPYTIELWARPPGHFIDDRYRFLISRETRTSSGRQGTGIWWSPAGVGFERWSNGVKAGITYAPGIPLDGYTSVVATYDGSTMRLYIGGRLIGSRATTAPLTSPAGPFVVGAGPDGRSGFFAGDLDELSLYDHALIRSHVAAHVATAQAQPCTPVPNGDGATYTPTVDDLGDTLYQLTLSTRASDNFSVASVSQSTKPVDDAGQLVRPRIITPDVNDTVGGVIPIVAGVAGLPFDRIEFLVDGRVRYTKVGESPLQYAWNTNLASNGAHTVGVNVYGPGSQTPVTVQHTVTVSN
jgi:hypothetical protein